MKTGFAHLIRYTHLSCKGQLTIPVAIQRALKWKAYDALSIRCDHRQDTIVLRPVPKNGAATRREETTRL